MLCSLEAQPRCVFRAGGGHEVIRTQAAIASSLALVCVATWCATLVASPSRAAAPPLSSAPATATSATTSTTSTDPPNSGPSTGPGIGPPVQVKVPGQVPVPNLIGLSEDEVLRSLAAHKLGLGKVTGTVGALVTAQNPSAGSFIDPQVPINVTLGVTSSVAGRPRVVAHYVTVPDLRNDSVDAARAALTAIGLTLSAPVSSGTVATQNPGPRQSARVGSRVSVTIAVVAAPTSARPRSPWRYWVLGALAFVALAVVGGSAAHRRQRGGRHHDEVHPPPPAPRVTSRLTADAVRTSRGGPAGPTIELRTRERTSLRIERIP
jgi:hypothetical protein